MGTQSVFPIGTKLTRRELKNNAYDELVVVGGGNKVSVQPTSFGETIELTGTEINSDYDVEFPEGSYLNAPTYSKQGPSPEEVFAEIARKAGKPYEPTPAPPSQPSSEDIARMEEAQRKLAERAAEELARTNTVVTEVQLNPEHGTASHEAAPVVQAPETEGDKEDGVTVTERPSPAKRGRGKNS